MKISFSPPYVDITVIDEVVDTLKSGWITTGPKVKALEHEIGKFSNSNAVLCVNSWTSGAIMMLKWLGLKQGDEVIIPAYTYSATALAVYHAGGIPVMVDVNDDLNISVAEIRNAISNKTKAIIPVDIAGWPCDYKEIMSLVCSEEVRDMFIPSSDVQSMLGRIMVIVDAAHSLGALYNGKSVGAESDITIFSLHAVKNVTTAEGGAICLNLPLPFDNNQLYDELRKMTLNCQTRDALSKSKAGDWRYDIIGLGMKINMPDVNAAIGLAQMRQYGNLLAQRKRISTLYHIAFAAHDWALLPSQISNIKESSYHIYALRIPAFSEDKRDLLIRKVSEKGVAVNVHFIPLPMLTFFKEQGFKIVDYPKAFTNYSCEISLPIYPQLTNDEVNYVIDSVVASYYEIK